MDAANLRRPRAATQLLGEWYWAMDICVVGPCVIGGAALLLPNSHNGNAPIAAVALIAIMACIAVGRPTLRSKELRWSAWALVGITATLAVTATVFSPVVFSPLPVAAAAVPAIYPIIFTSLPLRSAVVVTAAVTITPMMLVLFIGRPISSDYIVLVAFATVLGVIAGWGIGIAGTLVMRQRQTLLAALSELATSSARLSSQTGALAERERMAREIHDTLAQGFTSIVALSQALEAELLSGQATARRYLQLIQTTARENLSEARVIVGGLTPTALDEGSLVAAIRRISNKLAAEGGISVTVSAASALPILARPAEVVLLRATQEAFANIAKHARASSVSVELASAGNVVRLTIADNGVGLADGHSDGFGLTGMRARVAQVGGTMAVSGTSGGGVTIEIQVPA